jgi:hypothetical protein
LREIPRLISITFSMVTKFATQRIFKSA